MKKYEFHLFCTYYEGEQFPRKAENSMLDLQSPYVESPTDSPSHFVLQELSDLPGIVGRPPHPLTPPPPSRVRGGGGILGKKRRRRAPSADAAAWAQEAAASAGATPFRREEEDSDVQSALSLVHFFGFSPCSVFERTPEGQSNTWFLKR